MRNQMSRMLLGASLVSMTAAEQSAGRFMRAPDHSPGTGGGPIINNENWPAWFYGPDGQSEIFNNPLDVPDGWHDNPNKVGDKKAKTEIPDYDEAVKDAEGRKRAERAAEKARIAAEEDDLDVAEDVENGDADNTTKPENLPGNTRGTDLTNAEGQDLHPPALAGIETMTKEDIIGRLNAGKIPYNAGWTKDRLYDLLADNLTTSAGNKL